MWINWIERNKRQTLEGNFPNKKGMRSWPSYETDIASAIQFGDRPSGKFIHCFIISHFLEKILIISLQFKRDLKKRRRPGNPTSIGSRIRQAMGRCFNFCGLRSKTNWPFWFDFDIIWTLLHMIWAGKQYILISFFLGILASYKNVDSPTALACLRHPVRVNQTGLKSTPTQPRLKLA